MPTTLPDTCLAEPASSPSACGERVLAVPRQGPRVTVTLAVSHQNYLDFQRLLDELARRLPFATHTVVFDFARIAKLVGPWGVHFAQIIDFGRRTGVQVGADNLTGQPRQIAELFMTDSRVRSMLRNAETNDASTAVAA